MAQPVGSLGSETTSSIPYVYSILLIISPNRYIPTGFSSANKLAVSSHVCFRVSDSYVYGCGFELYRLV